MARIHRLRNPVRHYAWGSRTTIAELTDRPSPTAEPEAELWMGAHSAAPSEVEVDSGFVSLREWIREDPVRVLGSDTVRRFGRELPFLFKVLACDAPLSLQVHPDPEQARRGFERENAAGLALDDPRRSYRDPRAKPELVCALTPFRALCGFRPMAEIRSRAAALGEPELLERLAPGALAGDDEREVLRGLLSSLYSRPDAERSRLAGAVASAAAGRTDDPAFEWIAELARRYPGDPGVLAPILLHAVVLEPGQALFLEPGVLHSYLGGVAVELMANSDNVLRGGLTPKHLDVPELLAALSFRSDTPGVLEPRSVAPGVAVYPTPAEEFSLATLTPSPGSPVEGDAEGSVEILLCVRGEVYLRERSGEEVTLGRGESVFVPAGAGTYRVSGDATLYRAGVPR